MKERPLPKASELFWHLLNPLQILLSFWTWETWRYDSDVLGCISSGALTGNYRDLYFDGISLFETLLRSQSLRNIGLPWTEKYDVENGHWVMEIDSEETWAVINMAACSQERYTYCVSSATWWILGAKRSTENARHVIYDGSVSTRLMPFGWRIQWDNQHNFL